MGSQPYLAMRDASAALTDAVVAVTSKPTAETLSAALTAAAVMTAAWNTLDLAMRAGQALPLPWRLTRM
jgi:hypothetical protein